MYNFTKIGIRVVCTDFSWAFIHSALHVFMRQTIDQYLIYQFRRLNQNVVTSPTGCLLFVCAAHFTSRVARKINISDKATRDSFLRSFCLLQLASTLNDALEIWNAMVDFYGSSNISKKRQNGWMFLDNRLQTAEFEEVQESIRLIRNLPQNIHSFDEDSHKIEKEKSHSSIRNLSPFKKFFAQIKIPADDEIEDGKFCVRKALQQVERLWLPLFPLWSHVVFESSGIQGRITNAPVEAYFRWVKQQHGVGSSSGGKRIKLQRFIQDQRLLTERRRHRNVYNQIKSNIKDVDFKSITDMKGDRWSKRIALKKSKLKNYYGKSEMP